VSELQAGSAPRVPIVPSWPWWLLGIGAVALSLFVHPAAGVLVVVLAVIQRARPLDFLTSYLVVVALGSFVNYGNNTLTFQLTVLTGFLVFMLYCYLLQRRWDSFVVPRGPATAPLLIYIALTAANFVRGMVSGNSPRYGGVELVAMLVLASLLMVASRRWSKTELRYALVVLWVLGCGHFLLGAVTYATIHVRTIGVYFSGASSVITMLLFNYALRAPTRKGMLLWMLALSVPLAHEFLSFTRGYWLATFIAVLFSLAVYIGRTGDVRARAGRATLAVALFAGVVFGGMIVLAGVLGIGHIVEVTSTRLASSGGTEYSWQTQSNFYRLLESGYAIGLFMENPIFGHGLGYYFVMNDPLTNRLWEQYYVHENYIMIALKQGLIGLGVWLWMFLGFCRAGLAGRSLPDIEEQSWCTGTASVVVWLVVYMLFHFPLAETNTTFPFALMMGATMAYSSTDTYALRWKGRSSRPAG